MNPLIFVGKCSKYNSIIDIYGLRYKMFLLYKYSATLNIIIYYEFTLFIRSVFNNSYNKYIR